MSRDQRVSGEGAPESLTPDQPIVPGEGADAEVWASAESTDQTTPDSAATDEHFDDELAPCPFCQFEQSMMTLAELLTMHPDSVELRRRYLKLRQQMLDVEIAALQRRLADRDELDVDATVTAIGEKNRLKERLTIDERELPDSSVEQWAQAVSMAAVTAGLSEDRVDAMIARAQAVDFAESSLESVTVEISSMLERDKRNELQLDLISDERLQGAIAIDDFGNRSADYLGQSIGGELDLSWAAQQQQFLHEEFLPAIADGLIGSSREHAELYRDVSQLEGEFSRLDSTSDDDEARARATTRFDQLQERYFDHRARQDSELSMARRRIEELSAHRNTDYQLAVEQHHTLARTLAERGLPVPEATRLIVESTTLPPNRVAEGTAAAVTHTALTAANDLATLARVETPYVPEATGPTSDPTRAVKLEAPGAEAAATKSLDPPRSHQPTRPTARAAETSGPEQQQRTDPLQQSRPEGPSCCSRPVADCGTDRCPLVALGKSMSAGIVPPAATTPAVAPTPVAVSMSLGSPSVAVSFGS